MVNRRIEHIPISHTDRRIAVNGNGNDRHKTMKKVVGILVVLLFAAYGLIVADTRDSISDNKAAIAKVMERKVDKEQYYLDIRDIKDSLKEIKDAMRRR